jgi:hypothetical protein
MYRLLDPRSQPWKLILGSIMAMAITSVAMACDPAPCFEASPNPVLITPGQTEGPTALDWNAGSASIGVTITVEVEGQESSLSTLAVGQGPYSIELGQTYLFRIRDASKVQLASVTVTAKRDSVLRPAPDGDLTLRPKDPGRYAVAVNPIKGLFSFHGTFLEIGVRVKEPRNITAFVTRNPPNGCSTEGLDIVTVGAQGTKNYQLSHFLKLYNLEPATNYFWLIKMTNPSGETVCNDGAFRTKSRLSTLTVKDVHVAISRTTSG